MAVKLTCTNRRSLSRGWRNSESRCAQVRQSAGERRLPPDQADALAEKLSIGTWTHDYPLFATTAKELGLPASADMPEDVLELMKLYSQPARTQGDGGVEYLPIPRQTEATSREA
jgi:ClpP class serine protease